MASSRRPQNRGDFEVAIICALQAEFEAVEGLLDEHWEDKGAYAHGKAQGDPNSYSVGLMSNHPVVLVYMPSMGKGTAANVAGSLRSSFPGIKLGLVVGICGGVPAGKNGGSDMLLGDIIISTVIVEYDNGRQLPNRVVRRDTLNDSMNRPNHQIRVFLARMAEQRHHAMLRQNTCAYLANLSAKKHFAEWGYPGPHEDTLFESGYRHKHQGATRCTTCANCRNGDDPVCEAALRSSCLQLGCEASSTAMSRNGTVGIQSPEIHFGAMSSGDLVMKSDHHRDEIAARERIIGFEMEGAGASGAFPTIIIKSVCDYSDSHKQKKWQKYAATTAAACMKAFLKEWIAAEKPLR
ncbi:hypothetical protein TWF217_005788 [Orbilia oligospora]|nr:hypothetical protein TWF217_005788 [Orbilia oligospora]